MADHSNETNRAWAAGFIDGEGCFTLLKNNSKQSHPTSRGVNISVRQVKKEPLIRLQKILGGKINGPIQTSTKPIYTWRISGTKEAKKAIELVYPYLEGKEQDAELVYIYCLTVNPNSRKISDTTRDIRRKVIDELATIRES